MSGAVSRGRSVGVECAKLIQIIKARRTAGHDGMANWNGRATDAELSRLFYENEIPRNDRLFRCCQRSILIRSAPSAEWAVDAAKQQFAELEGIRDWKIHAGVIEIELVDLEAEPETPSHTATPRSYARKGASTT